MSDAESIRVEGSSDTDPPQTRQPLLVVGVLAGLVSGFVLAAVLSSSTGAEFEADPPPDTQRIVSPSPIPSVSPTVQPIPEPTLADLAPMLGTDLLGIGTDIRGSNTMERWRLTEEEPTALDVPPGAAFVDVSGRWLSVFTRPRYSDDMTLWVGNPVYVEPVSTSVLGAVWSSNLPATLAWTELETVGTDESAQTTLFTQGFTGASLTGRTETLVEGEVTPIWFTSEGVVVLDAPGTLSLITPRGVVQSSVEVELFWAATDRYALVEIDGRHMLLAPDLEIVDEFPTDVSSCAIARFAPPGFDPSRRVAMECQGPENQVLLHVWEIEDGSSGIEIGQIASLPQLNLSVFTWAGPDVIVTSLPVNSGRPETLVTVWDVETGASERISWPGLIYQFAAVER